MGNTRATAVFMIKYMQTFGFKVNNDAFEKNSWYFRNALVRANYNDLQNGVHATTKFLEMFFSNLILGSEYELKNRYMHVDYADDHFQSVNPKVPKSQFDTLECTLEELAVLELLYKNPSIKQKELVAEIRKSLSTFCTNYANNGMDIKNLQYLWGHSDAGVTLNVYTHASYAHAAEQMAKISQFLQSSEMKKTGKLLLVKQQIWRQYLKISTPLSRFSDLWRDIEIMIKVLFICHGRIYRA